MGTTTKNRTGYDGVVVAAGGGSVLFTEEGTKLLPIGTVLTAAAIEKLARYNRVTPLKETVFIKGTE